MLGERGYISVQCFEFLIGAEGGGRVLKRCLTEGQESGTEKKPFQNNNITYSAML